MTGKTKAPVVETAAKIDGSETVIEFVAQPGDILTATGSTEEVQSLPAFEFKSARPVVIKSRSESVTTPSQKPPSPSDVADGKRKLFVAIASIALIVLGIAAIAAKHGKAGIIFVIGGACMPIVDGFASWLTSHVGLAFGVGGAVFVIAWYVVLPRLKEGEK